MQKEGSDTFSSITTNCALCVHPNSSRKANRVLFILASKRFLSNYWLTQRKWIIEFFDTRLRFHTKVRILAKIKQSLSKKWFKTTVFQFTSRSNLNILV